MKHFRNVLIGLVLFALAACAMGPRITGHLSALQVQELMERGVLAGIFAGHDRIVIRLDNGDRYTALLPEMEKLEAYAKYRESIGKSFDYEME